MHTKAADRSKINKEVIAERKIREKKRIKRKLKESEILKNKLSWERSVKHISDVLTLHKFKTEKKQLTMGAVKSYAIARGIEKKAVAKIRKKNLVELWDSWFDKSGENF